MNAKDVVVSFLSKNLDIEKAEVARFVDYTKSRKFGDVECRIAFYLAKKKNQNPADTAKELESLLMQAHNSYIGNIKAIGPYLNFVMSDAFYKKLLKQEFGFLKKEKKVIVESPAVNPNKPWHIGHLRNALLGDAVANILEFFGYSVERLDYIDDLGLQVAQSFWYYQKHNGSNGKFDHFIGKQYVEASKKSGEHESEIRELLKDMEHKKEIAERVREFAEKVVKAQYETSFNYYIFKDVLVFESDIAKILEEGMKVLKASNAVVHEKEGKLKGCWVVKLADVFEGMKNPDKVLIRSDGTATYTGKDVIFHLWKFGKIKGINFELFFEQPNKKPLYKSSQKGRKMHFGNADVIVNVIGVEQQYPQNVIKEIFRRIGYVKEANNYIHLAYGSVRLKDTKFSGRKGTWIGYTADELLKEGMNKVIERSGIDKERAKRIALAAIKFSILKVSPKKEVVFDWDRALALEGDSGTYLLYSFVRASSILQKSDKSERVEGTFNAEERELLFLISRFPEFVEKSAKNYDPSIMAEYALMLAKQFSKFYSTTRIIGSEEEEKRLAIVKKYKEMLELVLGLLGIKTVDRM